MRMRVVIDYLDPFARLGAFVLFLAALALIPGVVGWFVGAALGHPVAGAFVSYVILYLVHIVADEKIVDTVKLAVASFLIGVPVIYALTLLVNLVLVLLGLAHVTTEALLLGTFLGALGGTGASVLFSLSLALKNASGRSTDDFRASLRRLYLTGFSLQFPASLMLAGSRHLPPAPNAQMILGVSWGTTITAIGLAFARFGGRAPLSAAIETVVFSEVILLVSFLAALLDPDQDGRHTWGWGLYLSLPTAVTCAATWGLAWLGSRLYRQAKNRVRSMDGKRFDRTVVRCDRGRPAVPK